MGADITLPKRQGLWCAAAMGPYEFSIIMSRRRMNRIGKIQALEGPAFEGGCHKQRRRVMIGVGIIIAIILLVFLWRMNRSG